MSRLLFEIGTEELPALSIDPALDFMKSFLEKALLENSLGFSEIKTLGTPRRLVLIADGIKSSQADVHEEITGPKEEIAFLPNGDLSPAGLGFINAKGIAPEQVFKKNTPKGRVIAAKIIKLGKPATEILPNILLDLLKAIPFKKRMRWELSGDTFARPIRWLLALFDNKYLELSYADVKSTDYSFGHRFMAPEKFQVTSIEQYLAELKRKFVMLSPDDRKNEFLLQASEKAKEVNGKLLFDKDLLEIVKNLVEWPFVIMGEYEEKYLQIPKEILICEMKEHQKCFAIEDSQNNLLPYFICSAASKPYDEKVFAKGNARVIRARFEDGAHYYKEDTKKGLEYFANNLKDLVFEQSLGSMAEKINRISNTAASLGEKFNFSKEEQFNLFIAAKYCKADLLSGVVGEFPELQGIMGRIYAQLEKQNATACSAIETHYWPRFSNDLLPPDKVSSLLAIADKLDTITGIIAIGKAPTASKDPFALRRAALGIIKILIKNKFSIELEKLISISLASYPEKIIKDGHKVLNEIKEFIIQRARGLLAEDNDISIVDGVLAVGKNNLLDIFASVKALNDLRKKNPADFESLIQTFKRAGNIVKKATEFKPPKESYKKLLVHPSEIALFNAIEQAKKSIQIDILDTSLDVYYKDLFAEINNIKPKLDKFFDDVMVMVENQELKLARLALLNEVRILTNKIADLGAIN